MQVPQRKLTWICFRSNDFRRIQTLRESLQRDLIGVVQRNSRIHHLIHLHRLYFRSIGSGESTMPLVIQNSTMPSSDSVILPTVLPWFLYFTDVHFVVIHQDNCLLVSPFSVGDLFFFREQFDREQGHKQMLTLVMRKDPADVLR